MAAPLQGIRVIEVANYVAGPSAGALMRDLGADVIKVEPPGGEVMRAAQASDASRDAPVDYLFTLENRGKRSATVALDRPGGPELIHRLLASSDILLTNLILPRLEKYTLTPAEVLARNPHVIHVSVTGYGLRGPDAARPGFDFAAFWTRAGIMSLVGHPGSPPVLSRIAQGDHTTGINALAATFAALRLRDITGKGQAVEVSLQQTGLYTIATDVSRTLVDGVQPSRFDREAPANPLFNTYVTADGRWLMIVHMTPDRYWAAFSNAIGEPAWGTDARYTTMRGRREHGPALAAAIQSRFLEHGYAYWAAKLDEHGLIWAPMTELPDVVADPQLREMGAFGKVEGGSAAPFETVGVPFRVEDADIGVRGPAPAAGEHTFAVLQEAGLSESEISDLAAAGILG